MRWLPVAERWLSKADIRMVFPASMRLPRWGRIRLLSSGARLCKRFQEQPSVGEFVLVRRIRQQLHALWRRQLLLPPELRAKSIRWKVFCVGEKEAIVEGELGVDAVAQRDVAEFVRQGHRQRSFIRKNVEQSAADHDGVTDGE